MSKQLGNILGGVKGREKKTFTDPFLEVEPSSQILNGVQRTHIFTFFFFFLKGVIWDCAVFLSSALEKVLPVCRLTQGLASIRRCVIFVLIA